MNHIDMKVVEEVKALIAGIEFGVKEVPDSCPIPSTWGAVVPGVVHEGKKLLCTLSFDWVDDERKTK